MKKTILLILIALMIFSISFTVTAAAYLVDVINNPNIYGTSANDYFGMAVSIDGDYRAVGAGYEDDETGLNSGVVYIYDDSGTIVFTVEDPNHYGTTQNDRFGSNLILFGDFLIVSATGEMDANGLNSGVVYVFDWWNSTLLYTLENPNIYGTSTDDHFGTSIAVCNEYLVVSAIGEDNIAGSNSGVVYLYDFWDGTFIYSIENPNHYGTVTNDEFGDSLAVDVDYIFISARIEDDASGTQSGVVYIWDIFYENVMQTIENPNINDTSSADFFGSSIVENYPYLIVSAPGEKSDTGIANSGVVYVFIENEDTYDYDLYDTIKNPNPHGSYADVFGYSIATADEYLAISSKAETSISGSLNSGAAYIYEIESGSLIYTIENPNNYGSATDDYFGFDISISDYTLLVGAYKEDISGALDSGVAYVFDVHPPIYSTVSFDSNGGTTISDIPNVADGTLIDEPIDPVKTSSSFAGWYANESLTDEWFFDTSLMPTTDLILYAKWTPSSGGLIIPEAETITTSEIILYSILGVVLLIAVVAVFTKPKKKGLHKR